MKITVLDTCTVTTGDVSLAPIEKLGEVRFFNTIPPEMTADIIADSEAVICNKAKITEAVMSACPNLRYIGLFATGYNNIDIPAAKKRGITVCNVPGYSTDSVAQHVFSFILHFACRTSDWTASVARGDWTASETFSYLAYPTSELAGKTLGIFGFGAIGRAVAKIGLAFGMKILATAHRPTEHPDVIFTDKETLFSKSDYLTLHCPLTEETRGLVNKDMLSLMKSDAVLINTARGGIVEEGALTEALNSRLIRGAGIDVLEEEPMRQDHPYLTAKNCMITPHIAWATSEARIRLVSMAAENLYAYQNGMPIHTVNK